jgi:hypothetical protein
METGEAVEFLRADFGEGRPYFEKRVEPRVDNAL